MAVTDDWKQKNPKCVEQFYWKLEILVFITVFSMASHRFVYILGVTNLYLYLHCWIKVWCDYCPKINFRI